MSAAVVFPHVFDISGAEDKEFILQGEAVQYTGVTHVGLSGEMLAADWSAAFAFKEGEDASNVDVSLNAAFDTAFLGMLTACTGTDASLSAVAGHSGASILSSLIEGQTKYRAAELYNLTATELEGGLVEYRSSYTDAALLAAFKAVCQDPSGQAALQSVYEQVLAAAPNRAGLEGVATGNIPFEDGDSIMFVVKVKYGKITISVSQILLRGLAPIPGFDIVAKNPLGDIDSPEDMTDVDEKVAAEERIYTITVHMKSTLPLVNPQ